MKFLMIGGVFLIGVVVGIIIPLSIPYIRDKTVSSVEEMEETAEEMEEAIEKINEINSNIPDVDSLNSVQSIRNAKSVLLSLEAGKSDSAKSLLIEEIGHFYYSWTLDFERHMNDES